MEIVVPILIIAALGACSGLALRKFGAGHLWSAIGGAGIATVLWVGGIYALFWFTAPSELGTPLVGPILGTFLIALASTSLAVRLPGRTRDGGLQVENVRSDGLSE